MCVCGVGLCVWTRPRPRVGYVSSGARELAELVALVEIYASRSPFVAPHAPSERRTPHARICTDCMCVCVYARVCCAVRMYKTISSRVVVGKKRPSSSSSRSIRSSKSNSSAKTRTHSARPNIVHVMCIKQSSHSMRTRLLFLA